METYTVHYTVEFECTKEIKADNPAQAMQIVADKADTTRHEYIDLSSKPYINVYEAYTSK